MKSRECWDINPTNYLLTMCAKIWNIREEIRIPTLMEKDDTVYMGWKPQHYQEDNSTKFDLQIQQNLK